MKRSRMAGLSLVVAMAGCSTVEIAPPQLSRCVAPQEMSAACPEVQPLPEGLSYGDLLKRYLEDRKNMAVCQLRRDGLAKAMDECNALIDRFNASARGGGKTAGS